MRNERRRKHRKRKRKKVHATTVHNTNSIDTNSDVKSKSLLLLVGDNYVVSGSFGLKTSAMKPSMIHIDTCSGVNIIRRKVLPDAWEEFRQPLKHDPGLGDANHNPLHFVGTVRLTLRLANRIFKNVEFLVTDNFAVDILLGTSFHNSNIRHINCIEQSLTLDNGDTVPILETNTALGTPPAPKEGAPSADVRAQSSQASKNPRRVRKTNFEYPNQS